MAQVIASTPLKDAGYEFVNLDCGYSTGFRDPHTHELVVNTTRYPHGMAWLGEQIHALGLKFGMYSAAARAQCCSRGLGPEADDGSLGHEALDAHTFVEKWDIDYLKYDDCDDQLSSYPKMRDALNATGKKVYLSIHGPLGAPAVPLANCWRTTHDISNEWSVIVDRARTNNQFAGVARPGAVNDADMLEVGNLFGPLGNAEGRSHFSMWAIMRAPLLMGTDLTNLTDATLATLSNKEVIAVNQDPLLHQAPIVLDSGTTLAFAGPLAPTDGRSRYAGLLVNMDGTATNTLEFDFAWLEAAGDSYSVRDLWRHEDLGVHNTSMTFRVPPHDCVMITLTEA